MVLLDITTANSASPRVALAKNCVLGSLAPIWIHVPVVAVLPMVL